MILNDIFYKPTLDPTLYKDKERSPSWQLVCKLGRKASPLDSVHFGSFIHEGELVPEAKFFLVGASGFEPLTPSASRKCSPPELRA